MKNIIFEFLPAECGLQGYPALITDSGLFIKNDSMNAVHKKGMIK